MQAEGRILYGNLDLYNTRHAVFQPKRMTAAQLETGYWRAYKDFYRWGSILQGASAKLTRSSQLRHVAYAAGWKKFEPLWNLIIRGRRVTLMLPLLETILGEFGRRQAGKCSKSHHTPSQSAAGLQASQRIFTFIAIRSAPS